MFLSDFDVHEVSFLHTGGAFRPENMLFVDRSCPPVRIEAEPVPLPNGLVFLTLDEL